MVSIAISVFCKRFASVWNRTSSWYLNSECYCLSWPATTSQVEISDTCWNSTDNSLVSEQILILQILFLCLFSFHNLFSSPTATQSCYSGLYMAKERHGRWGCSIFNAFREKAAARACRAHVWSSSSLSSQTLRNVGGWCPKNESHTGKTVQRPTLLVLENSLLPCKFMKHSM